MFLIACFGSVGVFRWSVFDCVGVFRWSVFGCVGVDSAYCLRASGLCVLIGCGLCVLIGCVDWVLIVRFACARVCFDSMWAIVCESGMFLIVF